MNGTIELDNGRVVTFRTRDPRSKPHEYWAKTRVYVDDALSDQDEKVARLAAEERALGDRRFATREVYPDVDKLYDKLNRAIGAAKKQAAHDALIDAELAEFGEFKLKFSRTAGCSCHCSPGVVLSVRIFRGDRPVDVWVSAKK